ncbi:MAG TPA: Gfo/Idh/MocA family oxidoreductase [Jatrophihabitans sp.]|jgi:predicted dehydrogenase|uniref:Gfo/Idh/MocA family protein n=1 Tax=Jatrophihabitans sp. TaxID=1932789 RepID=UPI002F1B3E55
MSMRVGLVGNGHWARVTHAAGLRSEPSVELSGIWGRDSAKTAALAAELGVPGYERVDQLFADVDAVAFSVPPQVQAELALRAARAGKHLLLEKPIAVSVAEADRLAEAVAEAGVASVVFFTARFDAGQRQWLDQVAQRSDWDGAAGLWLGSAFAAGSPFDTPWRHDKGGLWDVGPHALAMLTGALGPIVEITARPGRRDLVHLILRHESGVSSSYAVSIDTPEAASEVSLEVWGAAGRSMMPGSSGDASQALATAARELAAAARQPAPSHPCDVRLGRSVVRLLADAEGQLARRPR